MRKTRNPLPQLVPQRVTKLFKDVQQRTHPHATPLRVEATPVTQELLDLEEAKRQPLSDVTPGDRFGPAMGGWSQRWFRVRVPAAEKSERGRRHLRWLCQGEATAWLDDEPWAGLDMAHTTWPLPDEACDLWIEQGLWQGALWVRNAKKIGPHGAEFEGCDLLLRDERAWSLRFDLDVLLQLVDVLVKREGVHLPARIGFLEPLTSVSPLLRKLLRGLDEVCDAHVTGGDEALQARLAELFDALPAESWQPVAAMCGHAHIDLVWLWPERVTHRKGVHSFASVLRLMEHYDDFTFVQSQPALYRVIAERAPSQLEAIRRRVAEGRWEVMGGFEVEPDVNMPCGEALARSLVIGQNETQRLRGERSTVCWIPDVFGYSNCLPQILKLGGVESFYTTKLTWSALNRFPYSSFVWRGADGSEVLTHLCATGYNGDVEVEPIVESLRKHFQADVHDEMLLPMGFGDGGGGPTQEQLERARRLRSLAGVPRAQWTTTESFFDRLSESRDELPTFQGELYLEYHRGVLTTQSEFKRLYRRAETSLQAHEAVRVVRGEGPVDEAAWRRVAFAQFHDALPGSSIRDVYEEMNPELEAIGDAQLAAAGEEFASRAVSAPPPVPDSAAGQSEGTGAGTGTQTGAGTARVAGGGGVAEVVFNPLAMERSVVVEVQGEPRVATLRPLGSVAVNGLRDASAVPVRADERSLSNGMVDARFDEAGRVTSLTVGGEPLVLTQPCGFVLYHDNPASFDAWDIDHYTQMTGRPVGEGMAMSVAEASPARAVLTGETTLGESSRLAVRYTLESGSRWLRIEARVDWHEKHRLLKFHAPTGYRGRTARFGCPFGSIERAQHPGTTVEEAMWEVCGNRWAAACDDAGRGLAMIAQAKYGFSCHDGNLGVSLLRGPTDPDPDADMGEHTMHLALGRHESIWRSDAEGGVMPTAAAADAVFAPVLTGPGPVGEGLLAWENLGGLVPSWASPSTTGDGFVLRLHETAGSSGTATLRLRDAADSVQWVDFFESSLGEVDSVNERTYRFTSSPYQVVSLLVRPARAT